MLPSNKEEYKVVKEFRNEITSHIGSTLKFGLILFAVLFVGFGGWLVFAKIDKAAIATGEIAPGGSNKVVQHLEGGVIEKILVKEGDIVKAGEVLIKLSEKEAGANVEIYESSLNQFTAEYSRLSAERDRLKAVKYPDEWMKDPAKYKTFMDAQNQIFNERRNSYNGKVNILGERNNQLESEIKGLRAQLAAAGDQLRYTSSQVDVVEKLLASGNTTMSRLLDLKSRKSQIEGQIGEYKSSIAKTEQAISENKLNIINLENENQNDVAEKIKEAQAKMDELKQRGGSASDILSRTEIRAPIDGIVKDMKFKTAGSSGVIPPNAEVLTIVPLADELVAEVKIAQNDIDVVRKPNLKARVRLSAYSARHIPMLDGKLIYVSADSFQDQQTRQNYYKGKVTIDTSLLKKFLEDKEAVRQDAYLYPGMPVEVFIVTGARSPISYFIDPVRNDFRKAFREE